MNSDDIADAYDAIASDYARTRSSDCGIVYVNRLLALTPRDGSILDAGCGTGVPLARHLAARGRRVHGIDVSPRMIELARRNVPQGTFEVADMIDWDAATRFDGVLAWDSYFHLRPKHHVPVLRRFHRMLAPGGVLMVTVGAIDGEIRSTMLGRELHYASLSREAYDDALDDMGCEVLAMEDDQQGEHHVVVVARKTD